MLISTVPGKPYAIAGAERAPLFRQNPGGNPIQFAGRDPRAQIPLQRIERQADDLPDTAKPVPVSLGFDGHG